MYMERMYAFAVVIESTEAQGRTARTGETSTNITYSWRLACYIDIVDDQPSYLASGAVYTGLRRVASQLGL